MYDFFFFQHHVDPAIGVYIIDRYTYYALEFLERVEPDSAKTMGEFVSKHYEVLVSAKCTKSVF
jgi:glycosylphosphatidylinositol transamidase (GPIT) subunit GPI8